MKSLFKCTALSIALGLLGSSAAMAALGDTIGTGTLTLKGVVSADTCVVSVPTKEVSLNIDAAKLKSKVGTLLGKSDISFSLNNCDGKSAALALSGATYDTTKYQVYPSGTAYENSPFGVQITLEATDADSVHWNKAGGGGAVYQKSQKIAANGGKSLIITPKGNNSAYTLVNTFMTTPGSRSAQPKTYDITYTYTLTYL